MKRAKIRKGKYTYKGKTKDYWEVEWPDPNSKRGTKTKRHPNKRHAEDHAAKIDRDTDRGIHETASGKKTFGEIYKSWIALCEERHRRGNLAGNTLANYRWGADHLLPEFGHRQIGNITSVDAEKFVLKKLETLKPHSVQNFYGYLFLIFKHAVRARELGKNPLKEHPIEIKGRDKKPYVAPFEDVELLIQILHGPQPACWQTISWENQKIAFALRAFAGLRGAEIAALRWERDINLSRTTLSVDEEAGTISMVDGPKKPKSKAGIRTVPISQYLYDALLEHAHATDMKGYVIKNQAYPDKYVGSQVVSDMHHDLMMRANLTKPDGNVKFTGHDLRHWHISVLMSLGINIIAVAKRVGHHDASVTARTYAHVIEGTEDGTKESVPPIWHQRFARAEPGRATMIEGVASEGALVIDGTATRLIETAIPENAYPWVPEALRLLETGWRPSDVSRRLGQNRTTINAAFKRLGLPNPDAIRLKVRDRMFGELHDAGHTDKQIAKKMNCSEGTVYHWRLTKAEGVPNTRANFKRLMKKGGVGAGKKLTDDQVREVWDRLEAGESHAVIGKRFSVSHGLIGGIKSGQNYRWVKEEREKNEAAQNSDKSLKYQEKTPSPQVVSAEKLRESQLKLLI